MYAPPWTIRTSFPKCITTTFDARHIQTVTNVYRKVEGGWKLAHHHTDVSEAMLDVLKRLTEPA